MKNPDLQRIIESMKMKKYQDNAYKGANDAIRNEAKGLMQIIQEEQTNALKPVFEALGANLVKDVSEAVRNAIKDLKVDVPKIDAPSVNVPDIHIPPFNIPTPKVTVNVPKIDVPTVNVAPTPVTFPSEMTLKPNSRPFPVIMMDQAGKPVVFSHGLGGGATGGKSDFFTIASVQGFGASIGASIIDSSGVQYSGSNPVPVTFGSPIGQGDGSAAIRTIQAGDSISSVNALQWNGNTVSTGDGEVGVGTLRVVHAADIGSSVNIIGNIATLDVKQVSGDVSSINVLQINGNTPATGLNETTNGVLRVVQMSDTVNSVVVNSGTLTTVTTLTGITNSLAASIIDSSGVAYSGSNPVPVNNSQWGGVAAPTGLNETNAGVIRAVLMTDSIASTQTNNIAMTTLPTAAADAGVIFQKSDKLGRSISRPVNARELIATAYASITTGTEVTLITASAGQYLDLIYAMATNNSDAAVTVDLRSVLAGNIETSIRVPANGTAGVALPVPLPQSATGNAWTADLPDITGTTVTIGVLFSKES